MKARSRARERVVRACVAGGLMLGGLAGVLPTAIAAPQVVTPPPGSITPLPALPNYLYTLRNQIFTPGSESTSVSVSVVSDPANGLLFETGNPALARPGFCGQTPFHAPSPIVSVDSSTYRPLAMGCGGWRPGGGNGASTDAVLVAIDSREKVLFFSDVASGDQSTTSDSIVAVSEKTLKPLHTIPLPSSSLESGRTIFGMTYFAPAGQLIVLRAGAHNGSGALAPTPVVSVTAYDAKALASGSSTPLWDTQVGPCVQALKAFFGLANPYRSLHHPYLYVPCALSGSVATDAPRAGIVRLNLDATGRPTGTSLATPAPGLAYDTMFDPGSDRIFMPSQTNTGTNLLTYDGRIGKFMGRAAVVDQVTGENNPDENCVSFGLDPTSGRLFGVGPTGLTLLDGRRTPLAPGTTLADLGGEVQYNTMPVLPPDRLHPYRRILVNFTHGSGYCTGTASFIDHFAVFADRLPVTSDPSAASVDANTVDGPLPAGADTSVTYGANASGAGARLMAVGSYGGAVDNTNGGQFGVDGNNLPLGSGNRNVLAGFVQQTRGSDGSAVVVSTALGDGNGSTANGLTRCSSLDGVGGCTHTPVPAAGPSTGQQWPFPVAQCTRPGTPKSLSATEDGFYVTTGYSTDGKPSMQQVPGSDSVAQARADCDATTPYAGGASANAALQSLALPSTAPGVADINVGASQTSTSISQPEGGVVHAVSTATARGVDVSVGGFDLSIDAVTQVARAQAGGRQGTARASRDVTLAGVSVTSPAGAKTVICEGPCKSSLQDVVDRINAALPSAVEILEPEPAMPFKGTALDDGGHQVINGSPGGYLAVVQADTPLQYGDAQFNGVPANDGETTLLPALRIVSLYDAGPAASTQLDRQIVDLAPVEVDAELGISVLPAVVSGPPPPPIDVQKVVAGVTPLPRTYVPGTLDTNGQSPRLANGQNAGANVYDRALAGLGWIVRSPGEVIRIFLTLCLLGLPVLLATRRHQWLRLPPGGSS